MAIILAVILDEIESICSARDVVGSAASVALDNLLFA